MGTLCFLGPAIRDFNVHVPGVSPEGRGNFTPAFSICFSSFQNLEAISLDTYVEVPDITSLSQVHPHLRRLTLVPFVEPNELAHLTSLHGLEYLSVNLASHTAANLPIKLLGLRSLAVASYGRDAISAFITDMDAPQLQSFSMSQLYGNPEEIHQELTDVLRVLVSKCPSLTAFSWRSDQWMGKGERSRVKALADLVAPLLSVHTIRNFSAYLRGHMLSYTPSHIRAFAEAWPDLEVFDLRTADVEDGRDDEDPHADLESLVSLARHCPRLETLYIPRVKFDRNAAAAIVRPPAPHWLRSLDVADVVLCGDSEQDRDAAAGGDLFGSLMHEIFPAAKIEF